jgi:hypothetical protein
VVPAAVVAELQGMIDELVNSSSQLAGGLAEQVSEALSPTDVPVVPDNPPLTGQAPSPVPSQTPPVSTSFSASGAFGGSGSTFVLLLGVLASVSVLLLRSRFSWASYEFLKPISALRLAIERPG